MGRQAKLGAAFGIALGILVIVGFGYPTPSGTAEQRLANFNAGAWEIIGIVDVLVLLVAIPFAAYLRSVLEGKAPGTASAAATLLIVGVAFGVGVSVVQVIAISTLSNIYTSAASSAADRAAAVVSARLLNDIAASVVPFIPLVAGVGLFSVAMLNSKIFANWVADVGVASSLFFIVLLALTPFVSLTSFVGLLLEVAYVVLLLAWVFGSAAYLWRSARAVAVGAPAPG